MKLEIERKYLVDKSKINIIHPFRTIGIIQGYLDGYRIRVASDSFGTKAYLTIKKRKSDTTSEEYEYQIPVNDAMELLKDVKVIRKRREMFDIHGKIWEVDFFENFDFVIAEIELKSEDELFDIPDFCTDEVTHDASYKNCNLVKMIK